MRRIYIGLAAPLLLLLLLTTAASSCGDSSAGGGGAVSDAQFEQACKNGATLCKGDPKHGQTFGAQPCTNIAQTYAACDSGCRKNAKPIIDCQLAAADCSAFAACAGQ